MSNIIGRDKEIKALQEYMSSGKAEFIAVYGRRRVGKTFLIRELLGNEFTFEVSGTINGKKSEQMFNFIQALRRYGYDRTDIPTDWKQAFGILQQMLEDKVGCQRCIIFIDELPCFDTTKSDFIRAFDHFWNGWAAHHSNIKLIVCGSATSWMVDNIIDNHGGLHNRITHEMHLRPFTLAETENYFKEYGFEWNRLSILQTYMVLGGVPYYYSLLDKKTALHKTLTAYFLGRTGKCVANTTVYSSPCLHHPIPTYPLLRFYRKTNKAYPEMK